jgi:hypothetical protein
VSENGRQVTYKQLFDAHGIVQIPIIQRDYAQGRQAAEDVREHFLSAIHDAIALPASDPKLPLNLDFVYGSVDSGADESRFSPLDGQQRLTTLFLLHWYLAWHDDRWDDFERMCLRGDRSRFTYRVRPSSTEFFDFLVSFRPPKRPVDIGSLSSLIRNQPAYFRRWRLDPTIQSTLVMLDAIHKRFAGDTGKFDRLVDEVHPAITFQLLDLDRFGLSDDLYIKMNARGIPLTPFETFKARYEQELETQFAGRTRTIGELVFSVPDFVARRLDTAWYDLFWAEGRGSQRSAADVDDSIFNLFRVVALITRNPLDENCVADVAVLTGSRPTFPSFHDHSWLDEEFTATLIPLLESWCGNSEAFQPILPSTDYFDERKIFRKLIADSIALEIPEVLQFMAYTFFTRRHEQALDLDAFQNWMRVVHNLVVNSNIDRADRLPGGLRAILALLPTSSKIIEFLASTPSVEGLSSFTDQQINEEFLKAGLLLHHAGWRPLIDRAELHGYFRGQIEFLLDSCGALERSKESAVAEWTDEVHADLQTRFEQALAKAEAMFNDQGLANDGEYLWERALLSIGDYFLEMGTQNQSLLVAAPNEPFSWKRLLRGLSQPEKSSRRLLLKLWDDLSDDGPIFDQLRDIIAKAEDLEPWRAAFVNSTAAMGYCAKRAIRKYSDTSIYLLSKTQMNGAHAELFTYTLYHDRLLPIDAEDGFTPLTLIKPYYEVVGTEVEPGVRFRWQHAGRCFTFELEWEGEEFLMYMRSGALDELPTIATWLVEKTGFKEHGLGLVKRVPNAEVLEAIDVVRRSLDAFVGEDH